MKDDSGAHYLYLYLYIPIWDKESIMTRDFCCAIYVPCIINAEPSCHRTEAVRPIGINDDR